MTYVPLEIWWTPLFVYMTLKTCAFQQQKRKFEGVGRGSACFLKSLRSQNTLLLLLGLGLSIALN